MREVLIVSAVRTPLTKAHRGEFNITPGPALAAFAMPAAADRSGIDLALIEDAILGCGSPEGTTARNIARQTIIRTGLPISTGHPFRVAGSRLAGHVLIEGKRRGAKYTVVAMCIAGGTGAAGLFEIY